MHFVKELASKRRKALEEEASHYKIHYEFFLHVS